MGKTSKQGDKGLVAIQRLQKGVKRRIEEPGGLMLPDRIPKGKDEGDEITVGRTI